MRLKERRFPYPSVRADGVRHLAHALARVVVPVGALEAKHPLVVPVPEICIPLKSRKIV